jgi:tripartite-type tricarboxylate transporter receptor subunit TctC
MRVTIYKSFRVLSLAVMIGLSAGSNGHAQGAKSFLDGKIITFLVGSSAGGGTDMTARLIARPMERQLPDVIPAYDLSCR